MVPLVATLAGRAECVPSWTTVLPLLSSQWYANLTGVAPVVGHVIAPRFIMVTCAGYVAFAVIFTGASDPSQLTS
jgi:hypothetical protein